MESINLDMEDVFEEEAADDDFPSVGPLPDLPDREEMVNDGNQDEENTDVMSKLKDLSKGAAKKVVRKPIPKLDSQRLSGDRGIPILPKVFEKVQFKGKGSEAQDLRILMRYLEHWAHRLFPMMPFDEVLERIEKLGTKKEVQTCIKKMRLDMPLLNDEFVQNVSDEEGVDDKDKTDKNGIDEDAWDEIVREHEEEQRLSQTTASSSPQKASTPMSQLKSQLSKPLMDLNNSSQPYTATPLPSSSGLSGGLTPEQRDRIERNKQLALQKKLDKQGFKIPAVPPSPFKSPMSSPVISRLSPAKLSASISVSPSKTTNISSPWKHTHSSPSSTQNSPSFSTLVQNGIQPDSSTDSLVNKLSYDSNSLTQQSSSNQTMLENMNGETQSSSGDMSEIIPIANDMKKTQNIVFNGSIPNTEDEEMSEVIPNQDMKRNITNDDDSNLVKKQKLNGEITDNSES